MKLEFLLAAATALMLVLSPCAQAQSATDFLAQADALGRQRLTTMAEYDARDAELQRLVARIDRQLAATPQNTKEWAQLQVAVAVALGNGSSSSDVVARTIAAAEAGLRILRKEDEPQQWALAQMTLASALYDAAAEENDDEGEPRDPRIVAEERRRAKLALDRSLSVFTFEADAKRHVEARCLEAISITPGTAAGQDDLPRANPSLQAVLSACRPRDNNQLEDSLANGMRMSTMLMALEDAGAFGDEEADPADADERREFAALMTVDSPVRVQHLSAILGLELSGLDEQQLAEARRLRAQIDRYAPDYFAPLTDETRKGWAARVKLLDMLQAARSRPAVATTAGAAAIGLTIFDAQRGFATSQPIGGRPALTLTAGIWPQEFASRIMAGVTAADGGAADAASLLISATDARGATSQWTQDYRQRNFQQALSTFRRSFEPAWGPVLAEAARKSGAKPGQRLLIVPDGPASLMPLALLRNPATGRALIDDYEIVFAPTLSLSERMDRRALRPVSRRAAFVAPPESETGLAFAPAETAAIERHFPSAAVRASGAKAQVMATLRGASYWHFATHSAFSPSDPMASWLQIPGGPSPRDCQTVRPTPAHCLTLGDLLGSEEGLGAPRLVVLSACESGVINLNGNPEEFIGMPAAFLALGAAGVIASLWEVDDAATTLLMAKLYDLHLRGGETPPAALRHAQLWLRDADKAQLGTFIDSLSIQTADAETLRSAISAQAAPKPFADPVYWGAFVYFGA